MNELIDFDAIRSVVGDDGDIHHRLYKSYIKSASECVGNICKFHTEKDRQNVIMSAHQLKSAARTVGALQVCDIAEKLEKHALSLDDDELALLVEELSVQQSLVEALLQAKISET